MMRYNTLRRQKRHFRSFTGLTIEEFEKLCEAIRYDWQRHKRKRLLAKNKKLKRNVGGRMHDYALLKLSRLPDVVPKGSTFYGDGGYQGIQKDYPGLHAKVPYKRHRGKKELTHSEKIFNKKQRHVRIKVENSIAQLKKYELFNQTYRHSLRNYNENFRFIANVLSFRMLQRQSA